MFTKTENQLWLALFTESRFIIRLAYEKYFYETWHVWRPKWLEKSAIFFLALANVWPPLAFPGNELSSFINGPWTTFFVGFSLTICHLFTTIGVIKCQLFGLLCLLGHNKCQTPIKNSAFIALAEATFSLIMAPYYWRARKLRKMRCAIEVCFEESYLSTWRQSLGYINFLILKHAFSSKVP